MDHVEALPVVTLLSSFFHYQESNLLNYFYFIIVFDLQYTLQVYIQGSG